MAEEELELKLGGNGKGESEEIEETEEELKVIQKKLGDLTRPGAVSFTKEQIGLLKQMVHVPDGPDPRMVFMQLIPMLDFKNDEERARNMKAFDESDRLGMDLWLNIRYTLSLCAVNRGGHKSSRIGALLESLSHQTTTFNGPKGKKNENSNSRSPLSE